MNKPIDKSKNKRVLKVAIIAAPIVAAVAAVVTSISDISPFLERFSIFRTQPLKVSSLSVQQNDRGAKTINISARNTGDEPIIVSNVLIIPSEVADLTSCGGDLTSSLISSGKYSADLTTVKKNESVSVAINRFLSPKDVDRFEVVVESSSVGRLYELDIYFKYNESTKLLYVGKVGLFYHDAFADYMVVPEVLSADNLNSSECSLDNALSLSRIKDETVLSEVAVNYKKRALNLLASARASLGKNAYNEILDRDPTPVEYAKNEAEANNSIDCGYVYNIISEHPRIAQNTVRIVRKGHGPASERHVCSGSIISVSEGNEIAVLTASHCFYNRRTGTRIPTEEFRLALIDDSEFEFGEKQQIESPVQDDSGRLYFSNDIAILSLKEAPALNNFNEQCVNK